MSDNKMAAVPIVLTRWSKKAPIPYKFLGATIMDFIEYWYVYLGDIC